MEKRITQDSLKPFSDYIRTIEKELVAGNATEHTHRPALKVLLESLAPGESVIERWC